MEPWIRFCLCVLTCHRLALMLGEDDGPLFVFKRIRYYFRDKAWLEAEKHNQIVIKNSQPEITDRWFGIRHNIAEGVSCPYCIGVWLSVPLFLMFLYPTPMGDLFLILLSISGGQAFLQGFRK